MSPTVETITSGSLRAHVARPAKPSKAGVLVLSHWGGLDADTDYHCRRLASEGFTAVAWDPFSAYEPDLAMAERRRLTRGVIRDVDARQEQMHWIGYMREELGLAHVGGLGFCMGGRMGLLLGVTDPRLECFSAFYPTLRMPVPEGALNTIEAAPDIKCAVQIHYPGLDESTRHETVAAVRQGLESRPSGPPAISHHYPDARHGFLGEERQGHPGDAAAAAIAWPMTLAFFRAQLS